MKQILCYDQSDECMLFDEDLVAKPAKSELMTELEKHLEERDYIFMPDSGLKTAVMVDLMSQIRKSPTTKLKNFNKLFDIATNFFMNASVAQIDIIYDSYLKNSIKNAKEFAVVEIVNH